MFTNPIEERFFLSTFLFQLFRSDNVEISQKKTFCYKFLNVSALFRGNFFFFNNNRYTKCSNSSTQQQTFLCETINKVSNPNNDTNL